MTCLILKTYTIFRNACYTSDTEEVEQPFASTDIYGTTSENWY